MPKRIQLPDGRWVYVPDMDSYMGQIIPDPRSLEQQYYFGSGEEEEEEDEGTLAGSAWEGFKSIPSGVADIFLSGAQAAIGVATPFADLPVEKRLRRQASKRARERDPAYRDAFLPAVGTGLGQVAGLSAISRLPYGWYAAMGAGIGMGISDQTRRIADYEQRTGTNVPWYKESAAHMMGALIGLTEVLPIKYGLFPAPVSKMMGRMKAGLSPNAARHVSSLEKTFGFGDALSTGLQEATQEASAQWLQALSARGLYDPNAMEDIGRSMAEDFKVGGVVGGIAKLVTHQVLGIKLRNHNANAPLTATLKSAERRGDDALKSVGKNITGISDELLPVFRELGVEPDIADGITEMFGGKWASIPFGMDELLRSGFISRSEVEGIVKDFESRNSGAQEQLDKLIKRHSDTGNDAGVRKYTKAKAALDQMATERLKGLRRTVVELGGGLGEMGGLTGNEQYQRAKQAAIEADADESLLGIQQTRRRAERFPDDPVIGGQKPSFRGVLRSLMGGSFGIGGYFRMAEDLGTHRGPGSEQISVGVDGDLTISDLELASSDRANFDIAELGEILLTGRGKNEKASSIAQRDVDNSDVMDGLLFYDFISREEGKPFTQQQPQIRKTLDELDRRLEELESRNDDLYKSPKFAFTRELAEIYGEKKYASDEAWKRDRDEIQSSVFMQHQSNNAEISRIKREQSIIYLQTINQRLQEAKNYFLNNSKDKEKAARRVFGEPDTERFDRWLDETINVVNQSESNGQTMSRAAEIEHQKFTKKMAAIDVDASDAEKDALASRFLSENVRRHIEFPRDISASQFIKIADLFVDDTKDIKDTIQGALAIRALGNISQWKVRDELYDVGVDGIPIPNETRSVVRKFEDKLVGLITDKNGEVSLEDGRPEYISDDDIIDLLGSKNIYLRDGRRIGNALAKRTGAGVESRPFEKLLLDMTGASSWGEATYAQRLLMYSRLLQLPAHYASRGSPEDQLYLEGLGKGNYRPLFLPDFYHNPNIDSHIDFMTDRVVEITDQGDQKYPSLSIGTLRANTKTALGDEFNSQSFDESLARLIETGVFNPTDSAAPDVILSPDTWEAQRPVDESQIELGVGGFATDTWNNLLNNYGVTQFPWGTVPDSQLSPELTEEQRLGAKWAPVIENIFPEISGGVDVEFVKADDPRLINDAGRVTSARHLKDPNRIIISYGKVQELAKRAKEGKGFSVKAENANVEKYLRHVSDIDRDFLDTDEVMLFVLAHEIAHERFPAQEAGVSIPPDWEGVAAGITMLSGGAKGSDTLWGKIGLGYGLLSDNIKHLHAPQHRKSTLPSMNTEVSDELLAEADVHLRKAATALGKEFSGGTGYVADLLRRNWLQVKYADQIFAIGTWDKKRPGAVEGGTGWGVQMAIDNNKQVFFFDQNKGQWYTVDKGNWTRISTPTIETSRFAGVGTRQINAAGRKAIEDVYNKTKKERGVSESRGAYENQINNMALTEVDRYMRSQVEPLYEEQKIEERRKESERLPTAVSESRVRFNVSYKPLDLTMEGVTQPGDTRVQDKESWVIESDPELVRSKLAEKNTPWTSQVDDLLVRYNEKNPGKPLNKKEFIEKYTALLTSTSAPLQELSDLGILDTIQGTIARPDRMAPTESILQLGTAGGRSLVQALMKTGAIPSSLQDNIHALRRRYVDTIETRFEILDRNVEDLVKKMRLPDNIQRMYVDDANGLFQFLGDVAVRGEEMSADLPAIYDRPGNRIIINLAAIDPNNMESAQEVVRDAAFHEGLHALIIRDHLTEEELEVLYNFVRNENNIVPKEIDEEAYNAKLTWFERAVVESADKKVDLAEADIEKEAVISLLQNMVRHPDAYIEGKKTRKIGKGIRGFLEGFVDAAKDADIVDVMKILGRIERGEVGDRGAGFLGDKEYTVDSIVRSNDLLRYANPEDIEQLRTAIVLRDAAPSDQMRISEQAKVDDIADKIIANRGIIRESAGPIPNTVEAIENQRKLVQSMRDTHTGSVALIGLDQNKKNSEEYKLALDTFMEMRGKHPDYAYKMPAQYQTLFNNKSKSSSGALSLAHDAIESGLMSSVDGDATRKSFDKDGALDPDDLTGDTVEATESNLEKTTEELRYLYLDRRQWVVKQTDKLLAAQNRAQLDAETSALVMWRNSDNALNWLPGLMLRGPLSYLGTSVGSGRFENAPVYDDELQETYGGDGRIQGLNEIFAPIIDSKDTETAFLYGMAKRILWTKDRRDSLRSLSEDVRREDLDPAVRLKLERFEQAYDAINPERTTRERGRQNKFSEDKLNEIIREVETNESNQFIVEFWDRYNAYDNHMIKMSYNTGMITREMRDEWLSMPYAPFYRDVATDEDFPVGSREEIRKRGVNLVEKALTGSMDPISSDLADGVIRNTQALVRDAMMNASVSRTVRDAVALGDARKINISSMAGSLDNRVVRVMEEGIPVFYEFDDVQLAMSTMMLGFNPKKQLQELFGGRKLGELTQKALTGSSSLLRDAVTRTPPFAIKNVFRDSWNAMTLTGGGPELVLEAFRNALDTDILRRADEAGLSIGIDFVAEPGQYGKVMQRELDKANLDWKKPFTPLAAAWNLTGRIAKQSEVATRLAVYDRVLAMTGDKSLAQYYAIEIMNYGRRGASPTLSTYMATVPFMNGRLQGMDVTYRGLRGKKGSSDIPGVFGYGLTADKYEGLPMWQKSRGMVLGRGLLLTAATSVLYFLMRDDDEWQDLRDEVKADNWVLPMSDHAWLKIPIPFEVGVLFKVIPEKILEAIVEKDVGAVDVGEETWRQLRTSLSIGGPQLFSPVVNAMRNYDTFRKDAIVDSWMEETLSPNEQRNMYTSNVARGIADFANSIPLVKNLDFLTSPMKVEYMMRQYVGTMGGYVVTVADRVARTGWLPDLPYDPYMNLAEAESVIGTTKDFDFKSLIGGEGVVNVPILGDLLTDPRTRGGRQQEFFEMIEELDTTVATLNSITERDRKKGFEYREKHLNILRHQRQLRYIQNQMRKWRERRDLLGKLPRGSMSDDEKREYYQRLLESRQSILTGVDTLMTSIKQG